MYKQVHHGLNSLFLAKSAVCRINIRLRTNTSRAVKSHERIILILRGQMTGVGITVESLDIVGIVAVALVHVSASVGGKLLASLALVESDIVDNSLADLVASNLGDTAASDQDEGRLAPGRVQAGCLVSCVLEHLAAGDEEDNVGGNFLGLAAENLDGFTDLGVVAHGWGIDHARCHEGSAASGIVET